MQKTTSGVTRTYVYNVGGELVAGKGDVLMCPRSGLPRMNADSLRQIRLGALNIGHLGSGAPAGGGGQSGGWRVSARVALDGKE